MESFLKVSNLYKSYEGTEILHGISFAVETGEFVSLLGPSGCGKTTTLRCIAGLEVPDKRSDDIRLGGQVLSSKSQFVDIEKRGFGMVFQSYAVWPHMDVASNITFPLKMAQKRDDEIRLRLNDVLDLVHLKGLEKRYGHELSGGQQQRVALGRALIMSPRLLLLDEPLSNLDALLREELRVEIQRLQKKLKITTILVTHDQKEALSLSDRIILMKSGAIDAQGKPEELYTNPPTAFVSEFLLGGQMLTKSSGERILIVPRKWKLSDRGESAQLISRLYMGSEYEYWAKSAYFNEPIKFYEEKRLSLSEPINLSYLG